MDDIRYHIIQFKDSKNTCINHNCWN